jgi:putative FmdB family regulatory protein
MPMYEYHCDSCGVQYEQLRRMSQADTGLECPVCGSEKVERQLSTFACGSGGGAAAPMRGACGQGGGGCGARGGFT